MKFNYRVVKFTNGKYGARFFEVSLSRIGYGYIGRNRGGYLVYCIEFPNEQAWYSFNFFFKTKELAKEALEEFIKENTPQIRVVEVLK